MSKRIYHNNIAFVNCCHSMELVFADFSDFFCPAKCWEFPSLRYSFDTLRLDSKHKKITYKFCLVEG